MPAFLRNDLQGHHEEAHDAAGATEVWGGKRAVDSVSVTAALSKQRVLILRHKKQLEQVPEAPVLGGLGRR